MIHYLLILRFEVYAMFCKDYDSLISLLSRRNYTVHTARDSAQARDILLSLVPEGSTAGFGGSMTAKELCLAEALRGKGCTTYFHWEAPAEERGEVTRRAARADWFIASANGITRTGKIVNIDGTGNRVASMIFGPKNVALIIGKNKFAETMDECMDRIKAVACARNAQASRPVHPLCRRRPVYRLFLQGAHMQRDHHHRSQARRNKRDAPHTGR